MYVELFIVLYLLIVLLLFVVCNDFVVREFLQAICKLCSPVFFQ